MLCTVTPPHVLKNARIPVTEVRRRQHRKALVAQRLPRVFQTSVQPTPVCTPGFHSLVLAGEETNRTWIENTKEYAENSAQKHLKHYVYCSRLAAWAVPGAERQNLSEVRNSCRWKRVPCPWCSLKFHYGAFVHSPTRMRLSPTQAEVYTRVFTAVFVVRAIAFSRVAPPQSDGAESSRCKTFWLRLVPQSSRHLILDSCRSGNCTFEVPPWIICFVSWLL